MSKKKQTWQDELDTLLARLFDEGLSPSDTKRLNEILSDNPAARDQYLAYMDVHEALQEEFFIPDFTALDKVVTPEPEPSYRRPILAMAALVMIGFFINFLVREPAQPPVTEEHAKSEPIAKVRGFSGSLIYTGDRGIVRKDLKEGDSLEGGTIEGMTPDAWFEWSFPMSPR